jgi:hypothetical protein
MTQRDLTVPLVFLALLGFVACDGGGDGHASSSDGGPAVHSRAGGRSPEAPGSLAAQPLLCPGCEPGAMPGGDTSDFGAASVAPCDGRELRRELTLEQAELEGIEIDADLDLAEGEHELSVRWRDPELTRTTLSVDIRRTGRARLTGWERDPADDTLWLEYPECPDEWTVVLPEVEVRVSTADDSVAGVFIGLLETRTRPVLYPGSVEWERPEPWWLVTGDGSALRGLARFTGEGQPDALEVSVSAVGGDLLPSDRGGITLSWLWWDQEGLANDGGGWTPLEPQQMAVPLDGCQVFENPRDLRACDPLRYQGCCVQSGQRVEYVRPEGGAQDDDAAPSAMSDR